MHRGFFFCKVCGVSHYARNLSSYLGAEIAKFVCLEKEFYHKAKDKCLLAQIQWMSWEEAKAYKSGIPLSKALSHQTLYLDGADICIWTNHWNEWPVSSVTLQILRPILNAWFRDWPWKICSFLSTPGVFLAVHAVTQHMPKLYHRVAPLTKHRQFKVRIFPDQL